MADLDTTGMKCEFDGVSAVVKDSAGKQVVQAPEVKLSPIDKILGNRDDLLGPAVVPAGTGSPYKPGISDGVLTSGFHVYDKKGGGGNCDVNLPSGDQLKNIPMTRLPNNSLGPKR